MVMELIQTESSIASTVLLACTLGLLIAFALYKRSKSRIPGPINLPLIGSAFWLTKMMVSRERLPRLLHKESKRYGDVISIQVGEEPIIFLHGQETIHDAFVKHSDIVSSRPKDAERMKDVNFISKGIINESGQHWKALRRFSLQSLRDFGVGKSSLEEKIMAEVDAATDFLMKTKEQPTHVRHMTSMMITNVIYGIVFGKRYEYDDEGFHTIIHNMDSLFGVGGVIDPVGNLPAPVLKVLNEQAYNNRIRRRELSDWLNTHIYDEINSHEMSFDPENIRDFIDIYFQTVHGGSDRNKFTKTDIFGVIHNFFLAGAETTSNTLNWSLLYLIENPEVQKRCQQEIHQVCGDRTITMADRNKLLYFEATLLEIQRISNIAELTLPHSNDEDMTINGYFIPKHSVIHANLYSVNMDTRYWDQPEVFNPERFIENGKIKKHPNFMPFGTGPRVCMGETLAKMELFLMVSNLLQRFTFTRENEDIKHTFDCKSDQLTSAPTSYKLKCFNRR